MSSWTWETTGLNTARDEIIEIGAVRIENGREVAEFSQLVNPGRPLPEKIVEITGITSAMVRDMPSLNEVAPKFIEFMQGAVIAAHNASFDAAFIRRMFARVGVKFDFPVLDTLALARNLYPQAKNHKLGTLCKFLDISLANAHRAVHDARATSQVMLKSFEALNQKRPMIMLSDVNSAFATDAGGEAFHIILLAKNQAGVTNLNRLVSEAHLHYFHRTPAHSARADHQIPRGADRGQRVRIRRTVTAPWSTARMKKGSRKWPNSTITSKSSPCSTTNFSSGRASSRR